MIGQPFNPDECCFLLSQSLNANQFNPNVPDTENLIPHNLLWNFVENKLQWINAKDNLIVQELGAGTSVNFPLRNIITVDILYGNDAQAAISPYDTKYAFKTCEAAVAAATANDLIVVNPGNYTITGNLAKNLVDWYFHPRARLSSAIPAFNTNTGSSYLFNIYGFGTFRSTEIATPFFIVNNSYVNITCNELIGESAFFQGVYVENNSICNFTAFNAVDCKSNLGNPFVCETGSKLVINAPEVRFSWVGYSCGSNSLLIANVPKTVAYDFAGDFTEFATSYAIIANGTTNSTIKIYGDMYNAKTSEDPGPLTRVSGALNIRSAGENCEIHIIGNKSETRGLRAVYNDTMNARIFVNTDIKELQGDGVYFKNGLVYLNRRIETPANPSIASGTPVFGLQKSNGYITLNGAVLINGNGGASIDGSTADTKAVATVNTLVGGTGYTDGTYIAETSGGLGTDARFSITVVANTVTVATLINGGFGYGVGDVLTFVGGNNDATVTVATLDPNLKVNNYQGVANTATVSVTEQIGIAINISPNVI